VVGAVAVAGMVAVESSVGVVVAVDGVLVVETEAGVL